VNKNVEQIVKERVLESNISEELISRIVDEVMGELKIEEQQLNKVCDPEGLRLIRGNSVVCEKFDTGNPKDNVVFKEILTIDECPNMATGFLEIEKSSFDWYLGYDELDYIIEGTLEITINEKTYTGYSGDVFYIPKDSSVTFGSPDHCKFFFTAYPANWQDFCEKKE